jgi:signal peptidase I
MKSRNKQDIPPHLKGIILLAGLIVGAIAIRFFFIVMEIKTDSMEPALKRGDLVLISRMADVKRGDIAVYKSPVEDGLLLISRAAGIEHESIEIRDKSVYINNEKFEPPWSTVKESSTIFPMKFSTRDNMPPLRLNRGEYFMLSDNFDKSFDSRTMGPVKKENITGRIIYIYEK